jgi:hypothetical protein
VSEKPPGKAGIELAEGSPVGKLEAPGIELAEGSPVGKLEAPGIELAEGSPVGRLEAPGIELAEGSPVGRLAGLGTEPPVGSPGTLAVPDLLVTHAFTPRLLDEWADPLPTGLVKPPALDAVTGLEVVGAFGVFTQCDFEEGFGSEETDESPESDAGDT